ncbi:MAG: type II secretion system protein N [Candidatus Accumulibacter sp.]|jgi:hypothetical protein|nr:type II secretion system protein N [Accumulibacter sp.]
MKRRLLAVLAAWRTPLLIAGVFIAALVVRLPASFVTLVVPQEIQLRDVEGSFWNGRASAIGVGGVLVQEQVFWNFLPRALLDAKLAWTVGGQMSGQTSRFELALRLGGAELNAINLALPLEPLAALHPQLKSMPLGAVLRVTAKNLSLNARAPVAASVAVEHLFTPLFPQGELGSYRLDCKGDAEGKGDWQIATVSGVLQVMGKGTFDAGQSKVNGQLTLTPQSPIPGLSPLLATLPKAGQGFVLTF